MRKRLDLFAVMDPAAENERGTKLRDRQKYDDRKHYIDKQLSHLRSPELDDRLSNCACPVRKARLEAVSLAS
jgi:hypothetical protein